VPGIPFEVWSAAVDHEHDIIALCSCEQYDSTGQQLMDSGFVLVTGR